MGRGFETITLPTSIHSHQKPPKNKHSFNPYTPKTKTKYNPTIPTHANASHKLTTSSLSRSLYLFRLVERVLFLVNALIVRKVLVRLNKVGLFLVPVLVIP